MRPGGFGEVWDATDEHGEPASPAEKRRQEHEWGIAAEQALRSATRKWACCSRLVAQRLHVIRRCQSKIVHFTMTTGIVNDRRERQPP